MKNFKQRLKNIGPGALVAAGFIGPGTVTTCTISGASFGYTLLWAMLFSILATIILQEMSGRLGIITQQGLGEYLQNKLAHSKLKWIVALLIISAIFIGNIAYETGNIVGGTLGLEAISPQINTRFLGLIFGVLAFFLLWSGNHRILEKFFIALVLLMSLMFLTTAIVSKPDFIAIFKGLFIPQIPKDDQAWLSVIGLIGTTVVPYNLFLHSSIASKKWSDPKDVKFSRIDTIISIALGGIISMAIIITASTTFYGMNTSITSAAQMATQLEPILGAWSKWFFGIGIFSAGFTSTITAPLSAAYAVGGILGWGDDLKNIKIKFVWITVLLIGVILSTLGQSSPIQIILFAQIANALILPVIVVALTLALNDQNQMGRYKNSFISNILAVLVITVILVISMHSFTLFITKLNTLLNI